MLSAQYAQEPQRQTEQVEALQQRIEVNRHIAAGVTYTVTQDDGTTVTACVDR